jgi:hypothetical protein
MWVQVWALQEALRGHSAVASFITGASATVL